MWTIAILKTVFAILIFPAVILTASVLSALYANFMIERGVHTPGPAKWFVEAISKSSMHVIGHLKIYVGWYITALGLFCSYCEISAKKKNRDIDASLTEGMVRTMKLIRLVLSRGLAISFILFSLSAFLDENIASNYVWMREKGAEIVLKHGYWRHCSEWTEFFLMSTAMRAFYSFSAVMGIACIIAIILFIWTTGFWACLRTLVRTSSKLALHLGLRGSELPLASIFITLLGIIVSLL